MQTKIGVVTFNSNEARAVEMLLDDLAVAGSSWQRQGPSMIVRRVSSDEWVLEHVPLLAQGNVVAAAQLAEFFEDHSDAPDYVVFYGCAAAVKSKEVASVFLVDRVNYFSLGTVDVAHGGGEAVTLKNKWLCHLSPRAEVEPLDGVSFPMCRGLAGAIDLQALSDIPLARVAATDKVVRVSPGQAPSPSVAGPPDDLFAEEEWSYSRALGYLVQAPGTSIVEMESYGIGRIAQALRIEDRVAVLRVTTDELTDHGGSSRQQRLLLEQARHILGYLILVLFNPIIKRA